MYCDCTLQYPDNLYVKEDDNKDIEEEEKVTGVDIFVLS